MATETASEKKTLRKSVKEARAAVPAAERRRAAQAAALRLAQACRYWRARHVAVYLSMADEFDTRPLIRELQGIGCELYAPKIHAGRLRFSRLRPPLRANRYRIPEPAFYEHPRRLDLIVLPLVAFDRKGRRLGMGGGFYDRLLARSRPFRRPLRVGLAYALQEIPAVPVASWDVALDAVVTERGLRKFA